MILFDRKKTLNQIMGPPPEKNTEEPAAPEHLHALAKEAIDAVHAKDPIGFIHAQQAIHMHFAGENDSTGYHEDAGE